MNRRPTRSISPLSSASSSTSGHSAEYSSNDRDRGDMYDFTDPTKIGPGAWYFMHLMARHCNGNRERELMIIDQIKLLCITFKCGDCQKHSKEYIAKYPPIKSLGTPYGLFYWTVEFRNNVNRRLGKPLYDPQTMFDIFSDSDHTICTEGCGHIPHEHRHHTISARREPEYVDVKVDNREVSRLAAVLPGIVVPNMTQIPTRYSSYRR